PPLLSGQAVEGWPAHAQQLRGPTDVPASLDQSFHQRLALRLLPRLAQGGQVGAPFSHLDAEVAGLDERSPGHDDRALHGVFQLPDVARPGVLDDRLEGRGAEPELAPMHLTTPTRERVGEQDNVVAPAAA